MKSASIQLYNCQGCFSCLKLLNSTHTHTTALWPFFWDHTGEPVPEENFWTLWCKGRLTEADTLTIQLGSTPSGLTSSHLHRPPPHIFLWAGCHSCRPTNSVKGLKATTAFRLGRRRYSSPQQCYLHRLCTLNVSIVVVVVMVVAVLIEVVLHVYLSCV